MTHSMRSIVHLWWSIIKNTYHLTLLSLYGDMMTKLADMAEKFESWNEDEMSDAELNYYLEVNNRVAQKRLEVS